jgi:putative transposase
MPWRETSVMDERMRFVQDAHRPGWTVAELCRRYDVSRKTGYKWLKAYGEHGVEGLRDGSHRPHTCPHAIAPAMVALILETKQSYRWGARKVRGVLHTRGVKDLPSRATIHRILERHGRVQPRRASRRRSHPGKPDTPLAAPNDMWSTDFKGQFRMGDGQYCYPLTVQDGASRFMFAVTGMLEATTANCLPVFAALFRRYGVPERIRSDNGQPFASNALGRLSTLSVWWVRLGIMPELIEPAHPQQNGKHERMHKTLKADTTRPPRANLRAQQRCFDAWRERYNTIRPHESLNDATPASCYEPSPRRYRAKLEPITYPGHFERRLVSRNGGIRWNNHWVNASKLLMELEIGFEAIDDALWDVYFGPIWLGRFHEEVGRIVDHLGRPYRRKGDNHGNGRR